MHLPDLLSLLIPIAHAAEEVAHEAAADPGIAGMFGLDWKLFLAQLINFGIVLFVLWKWVFRPVAKAMTERTEKIEKSLADAKQIAEDKQTFDTWKNAEVGKIRIEASQIITEAKQEAEKVKQEILDKAKQEQARVILQTQTKLEEEKNRALSEVKEHIADMVVSATESVIKTKLDPKKDYELVKQALEKAKA
jgi:F-type H+-transporting ATPase subunit b